MTKQSTSTPAEHPAPNKIIPTLAQWAGGNEPFEKLTKTFYDNVLQDPLLQPVFQSMSIEHATHVAHFIVEVLGGPKLYTQHDGGSHAQMVGHHVGKMLTENQRKRWIQLLLDTADEVGLPVDPEFRSAFVGYLEWGSRLAVINSQLTQIPLEPDAPMPQWGWGETGGPYQGNPTP